MSCGYRSATVLDSTVIQDNGAFGCQSSLQEIALRRYVRPRSGGHIISAAIEQSACDEPGR